MHIVRGRVVLMLLINVCIMQFSCVNYPYLACEAALPTRSYFIYSDQDIIWHCLSLSVRQM